MHNIYKPKYKICFQTKNKIWINKNSRLRNFFHIRNKVILNRSKKYKKFLILKNMKWTVARRFMFPSLKKRTNFIFNYKNSFYLKQQLKKFYGKLREDDLRKMFKNTWNKEQYFKRNLFIMALEQRLDIIIYRMRFLPTIQSANQLISHQGIYVNNNLITIPNYKVKLGDIVSVKEDQWIIFYNNLYYRLQKRFFAHYLLIWRKSNLLKKIQKISFKNRNLIKKNLYIFKEFNLNKKRYIIYKNWIWNRFNYYKSNNELEKAKFFKKIYFILLKKFDFNINYLNNNIFKLRNWMNKKYINDLTIILYKNYNFSNLLNNFQLILKLHLLHWKYNEKYKKIELSVQKSNLKKKKLNLINKKYLKQRQYYINIYNKKQNNLKKLIKYRIKTNLIKFNNVSDKFYLNYRNKFLIKTLKAQKIKKRTFKHWVPKHHWYTPKYLEVDYTTLRGCFLYYPNPEDVVYGFECSFDKVISFYKERAL